MPGHEARDNITKALNLMHRCRRAGFEGFLLSTDAEKAFDRVSWDFLLATCSHIDLKAHMLTWISLLYQDPIARLKVNGTLLEPVFIKNGIRQGCPLSPLLFILTLEPFIYTVNMTKSIRGFAINTKIYKIAAYADDLLVFFYTTTHLYP